MFRYVYMHCIVHSDAKIDGVTILVRKGALIALDTF